MKKRKVTKKIKGPSCNLTMPTEFDYEKACCPECGSKNLKCDYACHTFVGRGGLWRACNPCDSAGEFWCLDCQWTFRDGLNPDNPQTEENEKSRPSWLPKENLKGRFFMGSYFLPKFQQKLEKSNLVQYYIVDHTLKMRKGKIAGQCAHGAMLAIDHFEFRSNGNALLFHQWRDERLSGMTKLIKKGSPEDLQRALDEIEDSIEVRDLGHTQVDADTRTVVVLPVMDKEKTPQWVRDLPLL